MHCGAKKCVLNELSRKLTCSLQNESTEMPVPHTLQKLDAPGRKDVSAE